MLKALRIRDHRDYETGFKWALSLVEGEGHIRNQKDFDRGVRAAETISRMLGSAKAVSRLLGEAVELQSKARAVDILIDDTPPPCSRCTFIGICKQTELTCGRYRNYSGMEVPSKSIVPDRLWEA